MRSIRPILLCFCFCFCICIWLCLWFCIWLWFCLCIWGRYSNVAPGVTVTFHPLRRNVAPELTLRPAMRRQASALPVEKTACSELGEQLRDFSRLLSQHEGEVVEIIRQHAIMLAGDAQEVDPALEGSRRQELHLGVIEHLVIEAKPAAHAGNGLGDGCHGKSREWWC